MQVSLTTLILASISANASAFSSSPSFHVTQSSTTELNSVSRRNVFKSIASAPAMALIATSFSQPAFADVTNKIASQSSLRYVKRSMRELDRLELYAAQNDYSEIKQGLRTPALSEIRKNANVLIKGGEDGPEAENLLKSYAVFIKDIESLDSAASLGFRGKKGVELFGSYQSAVKDLASFAEIAERSVTIPIRIEDGQSS